MQRSFCFQICLILSSVNDYFARAEDFQCTVMLNISFEDIEKTTTQEAAAASPSQRYTKTT